MTEIKIGASRFLSSPGSFLPVLLLAAESRSSTPVMRVTARLRAPIEMLQALSLAFTQQYMRVHKETNKKKLLQIFLSSYVYVYMYVCGNWQFKAPKL